MGWGYCTGCCRIYLWGQQGEQISECVRSNWWCGLNHEICSGNALELEKKGSNDPLCYSHHFSNVLPFRDIALSPPHWDAAGQYALYASVVCRMKKDMLWWWGVFSFLYVHVLLCPQDHWHCVHRLGELTQSVVVDEKWGAARFVLPEANDNLFDLIHIQDQVVDFAPAIQLLHFLSLGQIGASLKALFKSALTILNLSIGWLSAVSGAGDGWFNKCKKCSAHLFICSPLCFRYPSFLIFNWVVPFVVFVGQEPDVVIVNFDVVLLCSFSCIGAQSSRS